MIKKLDIQLFVANLVIVSIIVAFIGHFSLLEFINILFYLFMVYLAVFLFLFIRKGKFFDGLVYGFRRFNWIMFKKKRGTEEDLLEKPLPSEKWFPKVYHQAKRQSLFLFLLLIILLFIFYFI